MSDDRETTEQAKMLAQAFGVPHSAAYRVAAAEMAGVQLQLPRKRGGEWFFPPHPLQGIDADCHEFLRTWTIDMLEGLHRMDVSLPAMADVVANGRALLPDELADDMRRLWPRYAAHAADAAAAARIGFVLVDAALERGVVDRLQLARAAADCVQKLVDLVVASDALLLTLATFALHTPAARGGIGAFGWGLDTSQGSLSTIWHCSGYVESCAQRIIGLAGHDRTDRSRYSCGLLFPDPDEDPDDLPTYIAELAATRHAPAWTVPANHNLQALAAQAARRRRDRLSANADFRAFRSRRQRQRDEANPS